MNLGRQVRGVIESAALYAALPDEVNQAKEMITDLLPEDMRTVAAMTVMAVAVARDSLHKEKEES